MNQVAYTLEEVYTILTELRSSPSTSRRFPKKIWESIINLTQTYSIEHICQYLKINPRYLKQKIYLKDNSQLQNLDFQEVLEPLQCSQNLDFQELSFQKSVGTVIIELSSHSGLKAKIQGNASCLNILSSLFKV